MTLKEIRLLFVEWSGRADLINEDGSDHGADEFIRMASEWLDEQVENPKSISRHIVSVVQGSYYAQLPRCKGIEQVWIMGTDVDGQYIRKQLTRQSMSWIRNNYNEKWSSQSQDTPEYYGLNVIGLDGSQAAYEHATELLNLDDVTDVMTPSDATNGHFEYVGMLFVPVADQSYTMNVYGDFYQKKLVLDSDINWWTIVKPIILVKAACRAAEGSLRNFAGESDWMNSLKSDLRGVDMASAGLDSTGLVEMGG